MKRQKWLLQGLFLGFVFFLAIVLVKPVGVSTQFSVVSGMIHSTIDPNVITKDDTREYGYRSTNAYYDKDEGKLARAIKEPVNYDLVFVLAIPLGALMGYLLLDQKRRIKIVADKSQGKQKFFYGSYFISGFLLLFGARMAGGCTSGHMMSGMMQGSVSGFVFAACVFAVAIPTAMVAGKREKRG